jgi:uncharacterized membrane protein
VGTVQETIDVHVPVSTAYNQWTQFESFPEFMAGVERVEQRTDRLTHWETRVAWVGRDFDAEIVEQEPDRRIVWRTVETVQGPRQRGCVEFQPLGETGTRVVLELRFEPAGVTEQMGDLLGVVQRRVRGDLERFKEFLEAEGIETGAWRGEVHQAGTGGPIEVEPPPPGTGEATIITVEPDTRTEIRVPMPPPW